MRSLPILLLFFVASCAATGATPDDVLEQGPPTPYSADQIQAECAPGTALVFRNRQWGDAARGHPTIHDEWISRTSFHEDRDGLAVFEQALTELDGTPRGEPMRAEAPWTALRDHAKFPPEETTRRSVTRAVAAGEFDCWLYERTEPAEDGAPTVHRFWFSKDHAGPPVLYEASREGEITFRMELLERIR